MLPGISIVNNKGCKDNVFRAVGVVQPVFKPVRCEGKVAGPYFTLRTVIVIYTVTFENTVCFAVAGMFVYA